MDKKFLDICIVVAALIISGTILYTNISISPDERYKVVGANVFDAQKKGNM